MIRELFHIGPLAISPFGVMMVVAFLVAWAQMRASYRRLGLGDEEDVSAVLLAAGLGGIAGGKIYYALLYREWRLLFDRSGLVWYGALLLGAALAIWVIRRRRLPAWRTVDATSPALALGYGVGRVGCFLVGDDYGFPTGLPWGVEFPVGLPGPTTAGFMRSEYGAAVPLEVPSGELVAVHPTQLYETLAALAIWLFGLWLLRRRAPAGETFLAVVGLLAVERFFVEFLRAKDDRFLGDFTLAQVLSLALLLALAAVWAWRRTRPPVAAGRAGAAG